MDAAHFDLKPILAPAFSGLVISAIFYGFATLQICIYYSMFRKDPWVFKCMVATVFVILSVHMGCLSATLWFLAITAYDDPLAFETIPTSMDIATMSSALVPLLVRCFFIYRLWKISHSRILPSICTALAVLAFAGALVAFWIVYAQVEGDISRYIRIIYTEEWSVTLSMVTAVACDITTNISLIWCLKTEGRSGFGRTSKVVDRLVLWTIETGVATSLQGIAQLIGFWTSSQNYVWFALYMLLPSAFANALLAALNGRLLLRHYGPAVVEFIAGDSPSRMTPSEQNEPIVINIARSVDFSESDDSKAGQKDGHPDQQLASV